MKGVSLKNLKKSFTPWLLMLVGVMAIIGGLAYYKTTEIIALIEYGESYPEYYEVVEESFAVESSYRPTVSVLGELKKPKKIALLSELSGMVTEVNFDSGQAISKGEVIFQIDVSEEQARLRASVAKEKAAQSAYQRAIKLLKTKSISQEAVDKAYADMIVLQSEIDVLNNSIKKKTVIAPFDGQIGIHEVRVGDFVSANQALASYVGESGTLWAEFSVPQFYPKLTKGSQVQIRAIDALNQTGYIQATVIASNVTISKNSRSLNYRARVKLLEMDLPDNTALEVQVPTSSATHIVKVPQTAVNRDVYGAYVFKLIKDNETKDGYRAKRVPVVVVAQHEGESYISQGIEKGTLIAGAGAFKLFEHLLVRTNTRASSHTENQAKHALLGTQPSLNQEGL